MSCSVKTGLGGSGGGGNIATAILELPSGTRLSVSKSFSELFPNIKPIKVGITSIITGSQGAVASQAAVDEDKKTVSLTTNTYYTSITCNLFALY